VSGAFGKRGICHPMLLNLVLIFLVFGAARKKFNPFASAAILGAIKGVHYFVVSNSVIAALVGFVLFGGLAAAMVYLLGRVDRKEVTEEPYPKYGRHKKSPFKWEYVPLAGTVLLLIFGELILVMIS
jgi:hypothetical protein